MTQSSKSHWPISILSSLASLINLALPLVLVRLLDQSTIGQFKIIFLYVGILPAFALAPGIVSGLAYWAGQGERRDRALRMSALSILASALLSAGIALALSGFLTERMQWPPQFSYLFAVALFGAVANMFFEEAAIATGRIWTGAIFTSAFEAFRTLSMLAVAAVFRDLESVLIAHTAIVLLKTLAGYALAYRMGLAGLGWDAQSFKAVWGYALPVASAWIFGVFINNADQFILSTHVSSADFAVYAMGCLAIPPLLIIEQSVTRVMIPQMSASFAAGRPESAAAQYRKGIEQILFLVVPAVAGLIVFADGIVALLFTPEYAHAAVYLRVFALSYLLLVIPYDSVPRARGEGGWIFRNFLFFSVFSLGLCYLGVRLWGPMGALAGALVSRGTMRVAAMAYVRKSTGWPLGSFLPFGPFLRSALLCLALSAASLAARPVFASDLLWFLICGPIFGIVYLGVAIRLGSHDLPRRVLMVTQYLGVGGLEKMILNLAQEYRAAGTWEPYVFAYEQSEGGAYTSLVPEFRKQGVPVETYCKKRGFSLKAVLQIARNLLRNDIRVLHSHDLNGLIYAAAAKVLVLGRVRLVHTQHSFVHLGKARRYRLYERFFTFFADEITVVSEDTLRRYSELGVEGNRVRLVRNGVSFPVGPVASREEKLGFRDSVIGAVEDERLRSRLAGQRGSIWALYIARLHPVKGHAHALRVWAELAPEQRRKMSLMIVGPATQAELLTELMDLAASGPDADRVHFLGGTREPASWIQSADVYVSCSDFEGMPLGPLEGLGAGLPALLSRIPGHAFLERDAELFLNTDAADGARKLAGLAAMAEQLGQDGYHALWERTAWIREGYSMRRMAGQYAALYARAAGMKTPLGPAAAAVAGGAVL
ncbi:MAG: glycosyltransferase [Bdellovibrionales bacterium]|nr:glycosyltransferase [Bdellovibrionales bacterium]